MHQKSLEFFWPLTEQIPLDLDYSNCAKPKLTVSLNSPIISLASTGTGSTWTTSIVADTIDVEKINFTLNKKPFIIKRLVLKALGISWRLK